MKAANNPAQRGGGGNFLFNPPHRTAKMPVGNTTPIPQYSHRTFTLGKGK